MPDAVENPDIIMVLPEGQPLSNPEPPTGYSVRVLTREHDSWWIEIVGRRLKITCKHNKSLKEKLADFSNRPHAGILFRDDGVSRCSN